MGDHKDKSDLMAVTLGERFAWWQVFAIQGPIKGRDRQNTHKHVRAALKIKEITQRVDEVRETIQQRLAEEKPRTPIEINAIQSMPIYRIKELDAVQVLELDAVTRAYLLAMAEEGLPTAQAEQLEEFLENIENLRANKYDLPPELRPPPKNGTGAAAIDSSRMEATAQDEDAMSNESLSKAV